MRGAIDLFLLAQELTLLRGIERPDDRRYEPAIFDALVVALSGRIVLDEAADTDVMTVLGQIWENSFRLGPALAKPG